MVTAYGNVGTYATPVPPIPICPQEPWEAQEYAHRDRSRVKLSFCVQTPRTLRDLRVRPSWSLWQRARRARKWEGWR